MRRGQSRRVYDNGKIFYNTLDNHTVAVDAKTGKEVWVAKLGEITKGQTLTMAPLAAHGKVFVGNSGGEMGIHGWVTALDENSGKIVWRAYSIGARQGRADRAALQALLSRCQGQGSGHDHLAQRPLAVGRRAGLGLDQL